MAPDLSESISVSWAFLAVSRAEARLSSSATVMLTTRATLPGIIMFKFQYTGFNELSSSLIFLPHSPFSRREVVEGLKRVPHRAPSLKIG